LLLWRREYYLVEEENVWKEDVALHPSIIRN